MKITITVTLIVLVLLVVVFTNRWWVLMQVGSLMGPPALSEKSDEPGAVWFDDYYTVFEIDEKTFAIAETRYWQSNFNYLIIGSNRALLLDAGPGVRDFGPVVKSLTDQPYVFTPSRPAMDT